MPERTWNSKLLLALVMGGVAPVGCRAPQANRALSPVTRPLEARARNHTRAALGAGVAPPAAIVVSGPEVTPATRESAGGDDGGGDLPRDADGTFVGLAISGGGSRSANFAAACMFELQRVGILNRVDYISSVSGGSLAAAYYCTSDDAGWNPQAVQQTLTHPFANDLILRSLLPWNMVALAATPWDRSDILAGVFAEHVFAKTGGRGAGRAATYADLRPDRPRLLVNATDLQSGRAFVFCNESFDRLNSDLSSYPLADAVAASSAVPVLLHPVTLRDYSTSFGQYRHLVDGGVADNLGVRTLVDVYAARTRAARDARRPPPYPRGAVFVVLDARTQFDVELSARPDIGLIDSLRAGASLTSTTLLNRVSTATLGDIILESAADDARAADLRDEKRALERDGHLTLRDRDGRTVRVVHLALARVRELTNLPFSGFGHSVNGINTYFNITPVEAYHLYQAADLLVREKFEAPLQEIRESLEWPPALTMPTPTATPPTTIRR